MPQFVLVFLLVLVPAVSLPAQTPSSTASPFPPLPSPVRDPQAVQIVEKAVAAMGGASVIEQVQDCTVQAQVQALGGSGGTSGSLVWTRAGAEFRSDFPTAQGTATLATGHGTPFRTIDGASKKVPRGVMRGLLLPAFVAATLVAESQNTSYSLQYVGPATIGAEAVTVVKTSSEANRLDDLVTPQTWYFDNSTGLPVRVQYRLPAVRDPRKFLVDTVDLSGYQPVAGVMYPFQETRSIGGREVAIIKIASVAPNTGVAPSVFDAPAGGLQ